MFCVPNGNRIEFYDEERNMIAAIDLYGSDVISAYINESGVGSAVCEDGSAYQIFYTDGGYVNYNRIR